MKQSPIRCIPSYNAVEFPPKYYYVRLLAEVKVLFLSKNAVKRTLVRLISNASEDEKGKSKKFSRQVVK